VAEALWWDSLIQNNFVRASPQELEGMEPGIIFALMGLWQGRAKYNQELVPDSSKKSKPKVSSRKSDAR
jgi:hypothetical protein